MWESENGEKNGKTCIFFLHDLSQSKLRGCTVNRLSVYRRSNRAEDLSRILSKQPPARLKLGREIDMKTARQPRKLPAFSVSCITTSEFPLPLRSSVSSERLFAVTHTQRSDSRPQTIESPCSSGNITTACWCDIKARRLKRKG